MTTTIDPDDSLFAAEQRGTNNEGGSWWQKTINLDEKLSFGTPTVMVTVLVNIFGIVIFLRLGWIVGTAGVSGALGLLAISVIIVLITVFSAIGICQRCRLQSGGIYFLISHVLGAQFGGAVSLVYIFGQAVGSSLVAVGFGETVNIAGVQHAVRAVTVLLMCVGIAAMDFILGGMFTSTFKDGVGGWNRERLSDNWESHYEPINCTAIGFEYDAGPQTFFSLFGVLFANFLGVLTGVNMGGELQNPYKNIAKGELSAIGISTIGCFLFIITFGASVEREMLLCDTLVGEKVSITKLLFLSGIYIASLSSLTAGLIGTPRVAAAIAAEGYIPILNPLAVGDGANNNPIRATLVLTTISIIFVLLGDLNYLAILSTLPFLFTYATVNYAYVSLAMSTDLKELKSQIAGQEQKQQPKSVTADYGSSHNLARDNLNALFPERQQAEGDDSNLINMGAGNDFYSPFTNRYVALCGAVINILICFLINFWMSIAHVIAIALLYYHIGQRCPTVNGVSEFSVKHMFQVVAKGDVPIQQPGKDTLLIGGTATGPNFNIDTSSINDDNQDYIHRKKYHHSENY
uniref:Amino acid permease/ SLC12A domain-containing protein n=1 Tax=Panagrolaimus sp. ES5 TaxID=591445 RepID=A0AC34FQN3_9BILA